MPGQQPIGLKWEGETPHRSSIKFQLREANLKAALAKASRLGADGVGSYFTERDQIIKSIPAGKWIQYKAIFDSENRVYSPIFGDGGNCV